ncbi:hypothetical protein [Marinobacter salarius]|uniref:Uncharacterized protein n=1 Tax=Marinobacter salarius TaxID=1420917 RepID=A0A1W6KFG9_9GAMM|nr:hypothetical protein [Marinobacter salarius]ARM86166.1 hypothetical protein MARSALSMR5_04146 [Marinobacter salarius]
MGHTEMSFKDALNDPKGRELIDGIEDTLKSLQGQESDSRLQRLLNQQVTELEQITGYRYATEFDNQGDTQ